VMQIIVLKGLAGYTTGDALSIHNETYQGIKKKFNKTIH